MGDTHEQASGAHGVRMLSREEWAAKDRAAFLSGEAADDGADADTAKPAKAREAAEGEDHSDDDSDDAADDDDSDSDDEDDSSESAGADGDDDEDLDDDEDDESEDDEDDEDDAEDKEDAGDAELAKRLAKVRKTEKRARDAIATERAALERDRAAFQTEVKEIAESAKRFEKLKARAKYQPDVVLAELGLVDEDFEDAAKILYARSKAGGADPKNREAAARLAREREQADRLTTLEKKNADLVDTLTKREQQELADRQAAAYVTKIAKRITDEAPLAKRRLAADPETARRELGAVAARLWESRGEQPSAKAVVKAYEKQRRRELVKQGVDIEALIKAPIKTPAKAGDKKAAAAAKKPGEKGDKKELPLTATSRALRDDIVAELEAGDLD